MNSYDTYREAKLNFVDWYCHSVYDREPDAAFFLYSGGIWFQRTKYLESQNIVRGLEL